MTCLPFAASKQKENLSWLQPFIRDLGRANSWSSPLLLTMVYERPSLANLLPYAGRYPTGECDVGVSFITHTHTHTQSMIR